MNLTQEQRYDRTVRKNNVFTLMCSSKTDPEYLKLAQQYINDLEAKQESFKSWLNKKGIF